MINLFKTDRPIIALILGFLLLMKLLSALGFIFNVTTTVAIIVGVQIICIAYVIYSMNAKGGGAYTIKKMAAALIITMALDFIVILFSLSGREINPEYYPRIFGAELTYVITILYILLSKKLKRFKETDF